MHNTKTSPFSCFSQAFSLFLPRSLQQRRNALSILTAWFLVFSCGAFAQTEADATTRTAEKVTTLKVGIKEAPPFVEKQADGTWGGIGVDLWQRLAKDLGYSYEWQPYTEVAELVTALADGKVDVGVAALTMTPERENSINFSHAFYSTGLAIASTKSEQSFWTAIKQLVSPQFMQAVFVLFVLLLGVGVLVWFVERRRNTEQFGGNAAEGIGSGLWWSAVTMTTVGYGDKAPVTATGRFIALVWMFASIITVSSFTAAIASAFTVNQLNTGIRNLGDLQESKTMAVRGSAAAEFLSLRGINYNEIADVREGLAAVAEGKVDAVVHDAPLMHYYISRDESLQNIEVLGDLLEPQQYAFGLRNDLPQLEFINRSLLKTIRSAQWQASVERFLE